MQEQDDQYIQLKLAECNFIVFFFTLSLLLHLAELMVFYLQKEELQCQRNVLIVQDFPQLMVLWFEDVGEILPHFAIPFVLVLLPSCYNKRAAPIDVLLISLALDSVPYEDRVRGLQSYWIGKV